MQKIILPFLIMGILTACTHGAAPGNYTKISDSDAAKLADDSAQQMAVIYPPALTHVKIAQNSSDAYGTAFINALRQEGYAIGSGQAASSVAEAAAPVIPVVAANNTNTNVTTSLNVRGPHSLNHVNQPAQPISSQTSEIAPATAGEIPVTYIVDSLGNGLLRITLNAGLQMLSRIYAISNNGLTPAGAWVRKE